ncbi:MAG: RNA polymerase-binding transcription factor DksA [Rhodospirillaceae bacterium]|nr:MAG: RNA polymerase-binding transcription factor DksA [Rhodospirillaceae bacterium]
MDLPILPPDYRPTEKEPYMSPLQLAYFRSKLDLWKAELLTESEDTLAALQEQSLSTPEAVERASMETDHALELRARDRARKLINKIDRAIARIEADEYGYCEETGEPIGLRRLEARPIATMTLEAQERHEKAEKLHRDERRMS